MVDGIVIWGIVWLVVAAFAIPVSFTVLGGLGLLLFNEAGGAVGAILGWIVGITLGGFAFIQVILHIVHLIQFLVAA